ncbi:TetR/AcrR family transcriptional regulator [Paenibacillus sp. MMS20-IR301]|uniref:TetR/AcrR family transcriptional regulator n=1 Tax=Paenibacillus sp. MMS20-IR301 TaxID=2895946 RepID=UPI0028EBF059|nr:TetR/AcrR family transcriptional regulator [Paenibacillus sp. MMS20-IR301]WNS43109.1 TetR/AcrR family transcriptional regulator [Paenibacillus sp. MMS20-IR301]
MRKGAAAIDKKSIVTERKLLHNAKMEFMEKGFHGANMRSIAQRAGMTTGAIYRYFATKDALLVALTQPVLNELNQLFEHSATVHTQALDDNDSEASMLLAEHNLNGFVDFIFRNHDEFALLLNSSAGSSLENFWESWIESDIVATQQYMESLVELGLLSHCPPGRYISIFVKQSFAFVLETVSSGMSYEQAKEYMRYLIPFLQAGWRTLLHNGADAEGSKRTIQGGGQHE